MNKLVEKDIKKYTKRAKILKNVFTYTLPEFLLCGIVCLIASQYLFAGLCLACMITIGTPCIVAGVHCENKLEELWTEKQFIDYEASKYNNKEKPKKFDKKKTLINEKETSNQQSKTEEKEVVR